VPWHAACCGWRATVPQRNAKKARCPINGLSGVGYAGANPAAIQLFQHNLFSRIDLSGDGSVFKSKLEQAEPRARPHPGDRRAPLGFAAAVRAARPAAAAPRTPSLFNADGGRAGQSSAAGTGSVSERQFVATLQPPRARGNTAPGALLALIKAGSTSSSGPAAQTATGLFSQADLTYAFAR
jgi:hypothetical protein